MSLLLAFQGAPAPTININVTAQLQPTRIPVRGKSPKRSQLLPKGTIPAAPSININVIQLLQTTPAQPRRGRTTTQRPNLNVRGQPGRATARSIRSNAQAKRGLSRHQPSAQLLSRGSFVAAAPTSVHITFGPLTSNVQRGSNRRRNQPNPSVLIEIVVPVPGPSVPGRQHYLPKIKRGRR